MAEESCAIGGSGTARQGSVPGVLLHDFMQVAMVQAVAGTARCESGSAKHRDHFGLSPRVKLLFALGTPTYLCRDPRARFSKMRTKN